MPDISTMPRGIDVSKHQGRVDWARVAAAGFKFGFARAIDDRTGTTADPQFKANYAGMKANGIFRGAYHFFRPNRNVSAAANLFINLVGKPAPGDLNPVIDVEIADGASANKILDGVAQWIDIVEAALARQVIIYTFTAFWNGTLGNSPRFRDRPLWIAHFTTAAQPRFPNAWSSFSFWQHSATGKVAGITGDVDLDRFNGSIKGLRAFAGLPPEVVPAPEAAAATATTATKATAKSLPSAKRGAAKKAATKRGAKKGVTKKGGSKKASGQTASGKAGAKKTLAASKKGAKRASKKAR